MLIHFGNFFKGDSLIPICNTFRCTTPILIIWYYVCMNFHLYDDDWCYSKMLLIINRTLLSTAKHDLLQTSPFLSVFSIHFRKILFRSSSYRPSGFSSSRSNSFLKIVQVLSVTPFMVVFDIRLFFGTPSIN